MAATGSIMISGSVSGLPGGGTKTYAPPKITLVAAVGDVVEKALANGDNSISIPSGATFCLITPPADNVVALSLGAAGADPISPNLPLLHTFPTGATAFIVHTGGAISALTEFNFG